MSAPAARPRVEWRAVDGILLLDKPEGLSSNQALQQARRLYRAEKGGHTGSLDPFATGVLPLCFGQATKIAGVLLDAPKAYAARLALGQRTASGDREGVVTETRPVPVLEEASVRSVLASFVGEIEQVPPMYSALKRGGQPLYSLARRGLEVERMPRRVRVERLTLTRLEPGSVDFEVRCSKGTYIRTLGESIAAALGTCGHLEALRRTEVGGFAGHPLHSLGELEQHAGDPRALDALLLPPDAALSGYARVALAPEAARRFRQGAQVALATPPAAPSAAALPVRVYDDAGLFLGLGALTDDLAAVAVLRLMCRADQ